MTHRHGRKYINHVDTDILDIQPASNM